MELINRSGIQVLVDYTQKQMKIKYVCVSLIGHCGFSDVWLFAETTVEWR